jgi:hypothetical protein
MLHEETCMTPTPESRSTDTRRRSLFAGATAVGAMAAVAALWSRPQAPEAEAVAEPQPAPQRGGGYALTERVKQYYETTRV